MAETDNIKNKLVTVESLSILHEYNENTYMVNTDPVGSGTMTIDNIDTNFIMLGDNIKLVPTNDRLEIIFLEK